MPLALAKNPVAATVPATVAAVAVAVALAAGFYGARWLRAERDEQGARATLAGAVRAARGARAAMVAAVLMAGATVDMWLRGRGR